jgi:hypothetical protein
VAHAVGDIAREDIEKRAPSAGGLAEALDARDVEMGLGRGGPVLSALEVASHGMDVPLEGSALFDVAIDPSGHVSVALTDVAKDRAAWAQVGAAAVAAVDTKRLHLPPGRGWHVTVRIDADLRFPSGLKPSATGTRFEATSGKLSETSMVVEKTPGFTISTRGKVCGVALSVSLPRPSISGGCDFENAGMPAVRIVSGRIVSEGRL